MTVLDAFAVLALLKDEPAAPQVSDLVRNGARLTAVGVAEVIDHLVRLSGAEEDTAALDLAELGLLEPTLVDGSLGLAAGALRARHYHRVRRSVSLADCVTAATAGQLEVRLASADPHLLDLCLAEGIATDPLPDSTGRTWAPT